MPRAVALIAVVVTAFARVALACPACVGQKDQLSDTLKAVGVFLVAPFLFVGMIIWAIRRAQRSLAEIERQPATPEASTGATVGSDGEVTL